MLFTRDTVFYKGQKMLKNKGMAKNISDKPKKPGVKISMNREFKPKENNIQRGVFTWAGIHALKAQYCGY